MLFATAPSAVYLFAKAQSISFEEQNAVYQLPYSGMLPDHPFYFVKQIRDGMMEISTRDSIKKAQLYLLMSDKKASAAISLAQKGKHQAALDTLQTAEELFSEIPPLLTQSKQQGVSPTTDFLDTLAQSNEKHKQVITDVMKEIPEGDIAQIKNVLELNKKSAESLKKLR